MNVLLVSHNVRDVDLIECELRARMPEVRLEVARSLEDAAAKLSGQDRFNVVLLNAEPGDGDPAALNLPRKEEMPVAVVALVEDNPDSAAKVAGAGADEYVLKRPRYLEGLPEILRRASLKYQAVEKNAEVAEAAAQSTVRRETTGATRFLLRNLDIEAARNPFKPDAALEESVRRAQRSLEAAQSSLAEQARLLETEREQRDGLIGHLDVLQVHCKALEETVDRQKADFAAEKDQWDRRSTALEQQLEAVERSRETLEQAVLQEEARQETLAAQHAVEIEQSEKARREIEQERDALKARIGEMEEASARLEAEHRETMAQSENSRLAIEDRHRQAVEKHTSERAEWESARNDLEQRNRALEQEVTSELGHVGSGLGSVQAAARDAADRCRKLLEKLGGLPVKEAGPDA